MGGSAHARKLLEALRRLREELRKQVLWYEAGDSKRASLNWLKTRVSVDHTLAPRQGCARDGCLGSPGSHWHSQGGHRKRRYRVFGTLTEDPA